MIIDIMYHYSLGINTTFVEGCFPRIVSVSSHLICIAAFESRMSAAYLMCFADSTSALAVMIFP